MDEFEFIELPSSTTVLSSSSDEKVPMCAASMNDLEERVALIRLFAVENWYPQLHDLTFPTCFVPLFMEELKELVNEHDQSQHAKGERNQVLDQLEQRVEEMLVQMKNKTVFARLSTRSAKDAAFGTEKARTMLQEAMGRLSREEIQDESKCVALLCDVARKCMQSTSAKEIIQLLTSSHRIWVDLLAIVNHQHKSDVQLILREWTDFPLSSEFRCFIYNNRITAIGQYFHFLYFPELLAQQDTIKERICAYYGRIRGRLPNECNQASVMDVAVLDNEIYLIEFNPWGKATGAGLFSWKEDKEQLLNGPVEIRLRKEPRTNFDNITLLPSTGLALLHELRRQYITL